MPLTPAKLASEYNKLFALSPEAANKAWNILGGYNQNVISQYVPDLIKSFYPQAVASGETPKFGIPTYLTPASYGANAGSSYGANTGAPTQILSASYGSGYVPNATQPNYSFDQVYSTGAVPIDSSKVEVPIDSSKVATPIGPTLTASPPSSYDPAYGGIPQVPNPKYELGQAIASNLAKLPQLLDLSGQMNRFNLGQVRNQYEASFPNYSTMEKQIADNLLSWARGDWTEGQKERETQLAAERGISIGQPSTMGGPTVTNMNLLKNAWFNANQLQQQALTGLGAYNAMSPRVGLYDPSAMFLTPQQLYEAQLQTNVFAAAPIPSAAAKAAIEAAQLGANYGFRGANAPYNYPQSATASVPSTVIAKYGPTAGYTAPVASTAPTTSSTAGWGQIYQPLNPSYVYSDPYGASTYGTTTQIEYPPSDYLSGLWGDPWADQAATYDTVNYNTVPTNMYPTADELLGGWDYDWTSGG